MVLVGQLGEQVEALEYRGQAVLDHQGLQVLQRPRAAVFVDVHKTVFELDAQRIEVLLGLVYVVLNLYDLGHQLRKLRGHGVFGLLQ